jgi:hypothetical protein
MQKLPTNLKYFIRVRALNNSEYLSRYIQRMDRPIGNNKYRHHRLNQYKLPYTIYPLPRLSFQKFLTLTQA